MRQIWESWNYFFQILEVIFWALRDLDHGELGGGFKHVYFHPYLGKIPILTNIFQRGWNHQLENHFFVHSWGEPKNT